MKAGTFREAILAWAMKLVPEVATEGPHPGPEILAGTVFLRRSFLDTRSGIGNIFMRRFALAAVAALAGPLLTKDEASAPPATVKFASVPPDMVLSDNLIGLNIVDGTNSNVGEIKDIVIERGKLSKPDA
ncbi:PRC-barrel domain-containing protein [Methylobacterium sp. J-059]|uniref:PRC-barrel domain-containing protein n=1 Tax=Methylobacterium sp. J-059 TaxID=2836643 RepID=UPI001FBB6692|nr:PRC-barrel domain-containing protein [Methylobacterium sp. J-059]MCJ2042505.1 PRC-barrel domain-containing protein [Methylobacterium sp. J-059]